MGGAGPSIISFNCTGGEKNFDVGDTIFRVLVQTGVEFGHD